MRGSSGAGSVRAHHDAKTEAVMVLHGPKTAAPNVAEQLPSKAVKKKPAANTPAGTWQSRLMPIRPIGGHWAGDGATGR